MVIHQPGQAEYRSVLPEEIDRKPFPAFPPSARLAILVGDPSEPGPDVIRVKVPSSVKLMPHQHPEDRVNTLFPASSTSAWEACSMKSGCRHIHREPSSCSPVATPHFHWAKSGTYVTQVSAVGPLGLEYIDPIDDPRNQ
jgi:hypothetical protein